MTLAATDPDFMWTVSTDRVSYVRRNAGPWTVVGAPYPAPAYFPVNPPLEAIPDATHQAFGAMSAAGMTIPQMDEYLKTHYGENYFYRVLNGNYSLVDRDNVLYATYGQGVYAFRLNDPVDPAKGIALHRSLPDASAIAGGTQQVKNSRAFADV